MIIGSRAIWPQRQDGSAFFCDNFDLDLNLDDNLDLNFDDNFDLNLKTDNLNFDLDLEITLTLKLITFQP